MSSGRHPILHVFAAEDDIELVQLRLFELGATGLEQYDQTTIVRAKDSRASVAATFEDERLATAALAEIQRDFEARLTFVEALDWATEWRRGFGPQRIGERLLLQPSWEIADDAEGRAIVTIDPENAFGSGDHETTRLVLGVLERRIAGGERVLDVGSGSGILSIAALRLGAASALGVDVEAAAIEVSKRNAVANEVSDRFRVSTRPIDQVSGLFDVVVANIETRVLVQMPEVLHTRIAPSGFLVLSGILRDEREELLCAFSSLAVIETIAENEWVSFVMESK